MFEFLVTLFLCQDPNTMTGCQAIGQKTAVYASKDACGLSSFQELTDNLRQQGLKDEDIDKELDGVLVICQQGKRVYSV